MNFDIQTYQIGIKSTTLNRKLKKGSRLFLNGLLLQSGYDYKIGKRNVKFTEPLEKGDILMVEVKE